MALFMALFIVLAFYACFPNLNLYCFKIASRRVVDICARSDDYTQLKIERGAYETTGTVLMRKILKLKVR